MERTGGGDGPPPVESRHYAHAVPEKDYPMSGHDPYLHDPYLCQIARLGFSAKYLDDLFDHVQLCESLEGEDDAFIDIASQDAAGTFRRQLQTHGLCFATDITMVDLELAAGCLVVCAICDLGDYVGLDKENNLIIGQADMKAPCAEE